MGALWIEKRTHDDSIDLRVAGQLVGSWVDVLERECRRALAAEAPAALEVSGLTYMSAAGAELLRDLRQEGLRVLGLSPLLSEMLDD